MRCGSDRCGTEEGSGSGLPLGQGRGPPRRGWRCKERRVAHPERPGAQPVTAYLGFSCSQHDPSIAVVDDQGVVVFAQANERGLKNKRGWHAPPDAFGLIEPILHRYVGDAPINANLTWSRTAIASAPFLARLSRYAIAALERTRAPDRQAELWRAWVMRHALY